MRFSRKPQEFHRPDRLPYLPILHAVILLKVLGEGRQRILRGEASRPSSPRQKPLEPAEIVGTVPVIHQIPAFQTGVNVMQINGLRRIHIVSPVYCVWPLCTAGEAKCVIKRPKTHENIRFRTQKPLQTRLAVMYCLAVHNIKTASCDILSPVAVRPVVISLNHCIPTIYTPHNIMLDIVSFF